MPSLVFLSGVSSQALGSLLAKLLITEPSGAVSDGENLRFPRSDATPIKNGSTPLPNSISTHVMTLAVRDSAKYLSRRVPEFENLKACV